jgi:hypothetical protein
MVPYLVRDDGTDLGLLELFDQRVVQHDALGKTEAHQESAPRTHARTHALWLSRDRERKGICAWRRKMTHALEWTVERYSCLYFSTTRTLASGKLSFRVSSSILVLSGPSGNGL